MNPELQKVIVLYFEFVYKLHGMLVRWLGHQSCSREAGLIASRALLHNNLGQVVLLKCSHSCASVTKQYNVLLM